MKRAGLLVIPLLLLSLSAVLVSRQTAAPVAQRFLAASLKASFLPSASGTPAPPPAGQETRALWVVRFTLTSPEAIADSVRRAKENGFTDLVVQVRGRGDAYYNSGLEPRAEELTDKPLSYDPLALMIREAHAVGLKVHAWLNVYLVANLERLPQLPAHLIYQHPEWMMVPRPIAADLYHIDPRSPEYLARIHKFSRQNRADLEGLYISPAHPAVKDHIFNLWMDVLDKYDVDGLHFDYVRYPNLNFDYSRTSLTRFRQAMEEKLNESERTRLAALAVNNPLAYASAFPDQYAQFRRNQVSELVERIYLGVKARKAHVKVSAAVFANAEEGNRARFQDWRQWMKRGLLDVVCPMAYTPDTRVFKQQMAVAVTNAAGRQVWGGIGSWRQPVSGTLEKIQVARKLGANGFILFSYDSAVKFSTLNPQKDYLERLHDSLKAPNTE